jgi:hypothetical protein
MLGFQAFLLSIICFLASELVSCCCPSIRR